MLKRTVVIGLLSAIALTGSALSARAGQSQSSVQESNQESAVIGDFNSVYQHSGQATIQQQVGNLKKGCGTSVSQDQGSYQGSNQATGVVGVGNSVGQANQQLTVQQQIQRRSFKNAPCYKKVVR
ncbi:hypothetical protein ACKFKG_14630 [Phormidesmis sp. 146-35]